MWLVKSFIYVPLGLMNVFLLGMCKLYTLLMVHILSIQVVTSTCCYINISDLIALKERWLSG